MSNSPTHEENDPKYDVKLCATCEALPDDISSYDLMCNPCKLKIDSEVVTSINLAELSKKLSKKDKED